jgi:hypothetical protein
VKSVPSIQTRYFIGFLLNYLTTLKNYTGYLSLILQDELENTRGIFQFIIPEFVGGAEKRAD